MLLTTTAEVDGDERRTRLSLRGVASGSPGRRSLQLGATRHPGQAVPGAASPVGPD